MDQETLLAQAAACHFVALDQEGWVWLVWGHVRIQLHADDFAALAELLALWRPGVQWAHRAAAWLRIETRADDAVQLWIVDAGLLLTQPRMTALATMVVAAQLRLASGAEPRVAEHCVHRLYVPLRSVVSHDRPPN